MRAGGRDADAGGPKRSSTVDGRRARREAPAGSWKGRGLRKSSRLQSGHALEKNSKLHDSFLERLLLDSSRECGRKRDVHMDIHAMIANRRAACLVRPKLSSYVAINWKRRASVK